MVDERARGGPRVRPHLARHRQDRLLLLAGRRLDVAQDPVDVHAEARRECTTGERVQSSVGRSVTSRERILFVCTANIDRSRTAEDLYLHDSRYEVRSAGVAPFATVPLTRELLLWADRVFVLNEGEDQHRTIIRIRFPDGDRPIIDLDVEDRWRRGHPELVSLLRRRLRPHLGAPMSARDEAECRKEG